MNQHTQSIQQRKEEVLKIIVNCLIQYLELDQTTDNPEWSPSIMLTVLVRLLAGLAASLKRAAGPELLSTTVPLAETALAEIKPQQPFIVAESTTEETTPTEIFPPKDDSPESRLEKCFGPARLPIVKAMGYILEFNLEGCIRFVGPGNHFGTIPCSKSECEAALALFKANGDGLSHLDLASKVTRWRGKVPKPETVQRMVSRITGIFEGAGVPVRGRTENVNLSGSLGGSQISSKKRRPGRPPKPADGEFRAFMHEISPSISSC